MRTPVKPGAAAHAAHTEIRLAAVFEFTRTDEQWRELNEGREGQRVQDRS